MPTAGNGVARHHWMTATTNMAHGGVLEQEIPVHIDSLASRSLARHFLFSNVDFGGFVELIIFQGFFQ